jgi:salicylate hydroxylase
MSNNSSSLLGPNFYRILKRWGIAGDLHTGGAVGITGTSIRKGSTDEELASAQYDAISDMFQAPIWVCHRADLHRTMVNEAERLGANIKLGHEVTNIDFDKPAMKYRLRKSEDPETESEWQEYDVIIAADGVKSNIRRQMLALQGEVDEAQDTGQAAYRILIPRELMETDPDLKTLIDEPVITRWIAHRRHIIAYPISNKSVYNISTAHPDEHLVQESWTSKGSKEDMLKMWDDYCPRIQKMLNMGE